MASGEDIVFRIGADTTGLTGAGQKGISALASMEKQAASLKKQLDSIGEAGVEFQRQVNAWAGVTERAGKSARDAAAAFQGFDDARDAVNDLRASLDPAFAATRRFEMAVSRLDTALDMGVISAREHADTMAMLKARMGDADHASGGLAGGGMRMLTQQLSQVGQQTMATGNFVQALAMQLPDMGLAFGAVGTAVGLVAGIALPMLMQAFSDTSTSAEEAKQALDDMQSSVNAYRDAMQAARQPIADLREEYGLMAGAAQEALAAIADTKRIEAITAVAQSVKNLTDELLVQKDVDTGVGTGLQAELANSYNMTAEAAHRLKVALDLLSDQRTLEGQAKYAAQAAAALMDAYGSVDAMPAPLRSAYATLSEIQIAAASVSTEIGQMPSALASAAAAARDLAGGVSTLPGIFGSAAAGAWDMARGIWDAARAKAALGTAQQQFDRQNMVYGQVGARGDPRAFGTSGAAPFVPSEGRGGGGGGGGGSDRTQAELEALMNGLRSKEDIENESYAKRQAALEAALQQQLITQQQYERMMAASAEQHAAALKAIDVYRYGTGLDQAGAFFGDMASAAQSGGAQLLKISQGFAAAQALVASYAAAAQAMNDPTLPFMAKLVAFSKVLATGLGAVNAIKGVSAGGGGGRSSGGGGARGSGGGTAAASGGGVANITLVGDTFSRDSIEQLFRQINDGLKQGRTINLVRA